MKKAHHVFLFLVLFLSHASFVWGYGSGISSHPFPENTGVLTTELLGTIERVNFIVNEDGSRSEELEAEEETGNGPGLQTRYTHKINSTVAIEGGIGFSDSARTNRVFAGVDLEFFPDYGQQPRVALRTSYENALEFKNRHHILGVAPLVSKGFQIAGQLFYPFLALPVHLNLDNSSDKYALQSLVAIGSTTSIYTNEQNEDKLVLNFEGNINVKNAYSAVFLGLSYPFI